MSLLSPLVSPLPPCLCLLACLPGLTQDPEAQYSRPSTGGRQLKEELHYENAELYENMPSPKRDTRLPPKSSSSTSSSSTSASHYKSPVSKISSKFLTADTKTKATTQVTNTLLPNPHWSTIHPVVFVL